MTISEPAADATRFELWYGAEGVSITEYDETDPDDPVVVEEWWFTWTEIFGELTGESRHSPEIHAEP